MFRRIKPIADAYITDRSINGVRHTSANTGQSATLDIFKLYGVSFSGSMPNTELSRGLIRFDSSELTVAQAEGTIDVGDPTFFANLVLRDVYGGQPTPSEFDIVVNPLSGTFTEGWGRDIVQFSDVDVCNFMSASSNSAWLLSGCALGGWASGSVDYITHLDAGSTPVGSTVHFVDGTEDLIADITTVVSASTIGTLPNLGFRIALSPTCETDTHSYFVKRFSTRHAFDESKHPSIAFGCDDSLVDESRGLVLGRSGSVFLRSYSDSTGITPSNLLSGGAELTGSNTLALRILPNVSGSTELVFSASQHVLLGKSLTGVYSSVVTIPDTLMFRTGLSVSGSLTLRTRWTDVADTQTYSSGLAYVTQPAIGATGRAHYAVSVYGLKDTYGSDETIACEAHIWDQDMRGIGFSRVPLITPGAFIRNAYYSVRDAVSNDVIIPFELAHNATRMSYDGVEHHFSIDAGSLYVGRTYVVDALVRSSRGDMIVKAASPVFKVVRAREVR